MTMKNSKENSETESNKPARERGSALLVSLMVMVGLSLLGLGFVAISETESAISVNERNYLQAHAAAEAGALLAVEWFQAPKWAEEQTLLPPNHDGIKTLRTLTLPQGTAYSGRYKPTTRIFDKPFKPHPEDRFFGTEDTADIIINATTLDGTTAPDFLTRVNTALFRDTTPAEITDIRVFSPPIVGGTVNADGFWEGGSRYGLATIKVTAVKFDTGTPRRVIAQRTVKKVIAEWPFPGPQGPVQSNANIQTSGSFGVHWGKMTSELDMEIKRPLVGLPWFDAWHVMHFERGYYWPDPTNNPETGPGYNHVGDPNPASGLYDQHNWLYQIWGRSLDDPWYEARAKGDILNTPAAVFDGAGNRRPHPIKYGSFNHNIENTPLYGWSNWFQGQNRSEPPLPGLPGSDYKEVIFPRIDYNFWKSIAQAAAGQGNVFYLRWVAGDQYTDGVETKRFGNWVNTVTGAKPGFYFFDTRNGLSPQGPGAPGQLAPAISLNSASFTGNTFKMAGFIYLNVESFGTTGINGPDGDFNAPSEPFRDIGFTRVDDSVVPHVYTSDHNFGANNGRWDYQDLNGNKKFDIFLRSQPVTKPDGNSVTVWLPVKWWPGCVPGNNGDTGANCSEPHEPFLNLQYPTRACCSGPTPNPLTVGWENPTNPTRRPKELLPNGAVPNCNQSANYHLCTSNGYDERGALTRNFGNTANSGAPILDGILYNEGTFDTSGNAHYFGSVLVQGKVWGTGGAEVWFDDCLITGCWEDKFIEMPRVYVSAHQTDQ
jgi:hypothetical protein